jgi:predicted DsbA family dithiol-disulfide isomerase
MSSVTTPVDVRLMVDVWADVMCPFCYLGHTHLDHALAQFPHSAFVEVRYHSFELAPGMTPGVVQHIDDAVMEMNRGLPERGREVGLDYRFDKVQFTGTRKAHELIHFAATHGLAHEMLHRLFRAFFTEGRNVGDLDTLAELAAEVGLDASEARSVITAGIYDKDVSADIAQAQQLGVHGVPFFVLNGKYALSGAQPVEALERALQTAWSDASGTTATA